MTIIHGDDDDNDDDEDISIGYDERAHNASCLSDRAEELKAEEESAGHRYIVSPDSSSLGRFCFFSGLTFSLIEFLSLFKPTPCLQHL